MRVEMAMLTVEEKCTCTPQPIVSQLPINFQPAKFAQNLNSSPLQTNQVNQTMYNSITNILKHTQRVPLKRFENAISKFVFNFD